MLVFWWRDCCCRNAQAGGLPQQQVYHRQILFRERAIPVPEELSGNGCALSRWQERVRTTLGKMSRPVSHQEKITVWRGQVQEIDSNQQYPQKAIPRSSNPAIQTNLVSLKRHGIEHVDRLIDIDQSPIGRTPRSNQQPWFWHHIRVTLAQTMKLRFVVTKGRFSFNVMEAAASLLGDGIIKIEMHFCCDVYVVSEVRQWTRYNRKPLKFTTRKNTASS